MNDLSTDTLFGPLAGARAILLGVSGGPDSLAALALLADWAGKPGRPKVSCATFDHGFRAQAAEEAKLCARIAASLGIEHATLQWQGEKPVTRIQEEAREARYAALVAHAQQIGAGHLVTAHHADDQMETILFRMMRGSGIGGLAGMKTMTPRAGLIHARPFLGLRKAQLVAVCESRGLTPVNDPSNEDPRFARTGLRKLAPLMEEAGLGPDCFARLASRAARAEEALAVASSQLAASAVTQREDGETRLDMGLLARVPAELALRVLVAEISRIGRQPRLEQAEPLVADLMAAFAAGAPFRTTLGGALVSLTRGSALVISRELPRKTAI